MTSKQKSYYKSFFLTIFGLILWIIGFIVAIIFGIMKFNSAIIICIFVSLIGLVIFISDKNLSVILQLHFNKYPNLFYKYSLYGVPNNELEEFIISANELYNENSIIVHETSKGIFRTIINNKKLIFDLSGWHNKGYCLYQYFISLIQINSSNKNYNKMKKSLHISKISNLSLEIIFCNGKKKEYELIKNNKPVLKIKFKHRLSIIHDYLKKDKLALCDLFDFNHK